MFTRVPVQGNASFLCGLYLGKWDDGILQKIQIPFFLFIPEGNDPDINSIHISPNFESFDVLGQFPLFYRTTQSTEPTMCQ